MPSPNTRLFSRPLSDDDLRAARRGQSYSGEANEEERGAIAQAHGLKALHSLAYEVRLEPLGDKGWRLKGRVCAELEQICVITLEAAPARIDETIVRIWSPNAPEDGASADFSAGQTDWTEEVPELAEMDALDIAELEEEGFVERTPDPIDPAATALEAFTLALDPYPRAPGAVFEGALQGPPDAAPLTDEAARPFAGLGALRASMEEKADPSETGEESLPEKPAKDGD